MSWLVLSGISWNLCMFRFMFLIANSLRSGSICYLLLWLRLSNVSTSLVIQGWTKRKLKTAVIGTGRQPSEEKKPLFQHVCNHVTPHWTCWDTGWKKIQWIPMDINGLKSWSLFRKRMVGVSFQWHRITDLHSPVVHQWCSPTRRTAEARRAADAPYSM